jgi:diguanylate cyclase (GGDEF)-like protein
MIGRRDAESAHVLLIEPDRALAAFLGEMLRSGWSGSLAVTHAEAFDDAHLPLLSGGVNAVLLGSGEQFPVLERIRSLAPGIPVVVLAADYSSHEASFALQAGAQDLLDRRQLTAGGLSRAVRHALERKHAEAQISSRALQDPLTALPNRTLFIDRLRVALDRSRRTGAVTAVLFLDVDRFKEINDSLGHAAGDSVLRTLTRRLQGILRPMDTVARFGGDEFTFLFEDLSDPAEADAIASRVREAARQPIVLEGEQRQLSVSIGVATASGPDATPESLIQEADLAMYQSKAAGAGALGASHQENSGVEQSWQPINEGDLAAELPAALERAELSVEYLPFYGLSQPGRPEGFEALARWQHPRFGPVSPRDFIPVAHSLGLAGALGRFVFGESLTLLTRLRELRTDLTLSVNMSASQLAESELADTLEALGASGVEPGAVCVEIAEQAVSSEPELTVRAARVLQAAGVRISVDDYGTGSVSLGSLRALGADELKIHESFIEELDNAGDGAVVGAVVDLGHALGMRVMAEGVETDRQLDELKALGCDRAQGYLLGRPMPADDLAELIASGR